MSSFSLYIIFFYFLEFYTEKFQNEVCFCLVPGSLSDNDGKDLKNVTKNVNLRRLKLNNAYSISFKYSSTKRDIRQLAETCTEKRDARECLISRYGGRWRYFTIILPSVTQTLDNSNSH